MKNPRHALVLGTLSFATILLNSCREPLDLSAYKPFEFAIVEGDTVKFRADDKLVKGLSARRHVTGHSHAVIGDTVVAYRNPKFSALPAPPDLSALKDNIDPELKGKPLRMVAIGGNILAGVRDGGYFNEGIATSLPNLIARQMRLAKFEQPQFAASDYNGVGRKEFTNLNPTKGPVKKMKVVMNNTAIESANETGVRLKPFKNRNGSLDNLSVPFAATSALTPNKFPTPAEGIWDMAVDGALYTNITRQAVRNSNSKENIKIWDSFFSEKSDLILLEVGFNNLLNGYASFERVGIGNPAALSPTSKFLTQSLKELRIDGSDAMYQFYKNELSNFYILATQAYLKKNKNVIIINTPDVLQFPFFNKLDRDKVSQILQSNKISYIGASNMLIPASSTADSLLSPIVHNAVKPLFSNRSVVMEMIYRDISDSKNAAKAYNLEKEALAKKYNYPVVDFYGIYNRILANSYVTDDGVKVNPAWPGGNFFSTDGLHPTTFGQAVLANEVIKVINKTYGTKIQLIQTAAYL